MYGWWWTRLSSSYNGGLEVFGERSLYLLCKIAERRGNTVSIRWCFARESGALVGVRKYPLHGWFGKGLIIPVPVFQAFVLSHSSSVPICTSLFPCDATNTNASDLGAIFFSLATRTRIGVYSSSVVLVSRASPFLFSVLLWNHWRWVLALVRSYGGLSSVW